MVDNAGRILESKGRPCSTSKDSSRPSTPGQSGSVDRGWEKRSKVTVVTSTVFSFWQGNVLTLYLLYN